MIENLNPHYLMRLLAYRMPIACRGGRPTLLRGCHWAWFAESPDITRPMSISAIRSAAP